MGNYIAVLGISFIRRSRYRRIPSLARLLSDLRSIAGVGVGEGAGKV